ncbi:MAG: hypothetical protein Q9171_006481 [Xanthocarpia ochracea]
MSSSEDADSESSNASSQSVQAENERALGSSSSELIEHVPSRPILDTSSDHSSEDESRTQVYPAGEQPDQLLPAKEVTPAVKRVPSTRPNKYHGPPSTWRDWTAADRKIIASLDQIRAKDLSLHLYNFYCLKRRVDSTREWQTETEPDTDDDYVSTSRRRKAWLPVKKWTAWPMDPELVPREPDLPTWEVDASEHGNTKDKAIPSRKLLSDLLLARACKKAKERFQEREWDDSDVELPDPPSDNDSRRQRRVSELVGEPISVQRYEPVVMADDECAKSILQPSINHVLQKLDTLLMGLHHARNSYATYNKDLGDLQSVRADEKAGSRKRKRVASRTSASRASSRHHSANQSGDASEAATESVISLSKRKARLGLRDWSDVLGVASLSGFPPEVVAKAAGRCSNLFDEGVLFRTLYEGKKGYREVKYLPDLVSVAELQDFVQPEAEKASSQKDSEKEKSVLDKYTRLSAQRIEYQIYQSAAKRTNLPASASFMMQSTSTRAQSRFGGTPNTTISVTEAAIFLSGFYRNEATKTTLKDPRLGLEKPDENDGNASTLIGQAKGVEVQFKEVNQRQQPHDLPVIVLAKDTGGAETLWSPLTETDGFQQGQDAQDLKGKECQIIQQIHLNTANPSKDVCHRPRTAGLCITAVGRSTSGERQDLGNGMDFIQLLRLDLSDSQV